jgi:hypothetical protein
MISLTRHLHQDRLHECYLADRRGDELDPRAAEHLADCDACASRFQELADFLDGIRGEGEAEADEIFTPERLDHQRAQILHRVEHLHRSAHVISFPGRVSRDVTGAVRRVSPRWLAAAAAAGLLVGVAVGGTFSGKASAPRTGAPVTAAAPSPAATPAPAMRVSPPTENVALDDDRFLQELEIVLERPQTRELMPIDAWTPHIRQVGSRLR